MMPGVSGLELARELRQHYSLADLPILMVTALSGTGDFVAALDAGANDYLSKPFEKEEFLFRVANLTTLSRTQRAGQRALLEAARRERLRINSDLHDHLGANLTDLKTLSENALQDPDVPDEFAGRLREQVREIIHIFRNDLLNLEDLDLLEENFFSGINMMLLRRYVEAGRELEFSAPDDSGPVALGPDTSNLAVLATVIKEVVTNDLKYGGGTAYWKFNLDDHRLDIHFRSLSHYHLETHGTGKGTSGMLRRLSAIGGTLRIAIDTSGETSTTRERPIRIQINAPLGQAGTR
jgi:two-component system sensor histidine kinase ChiS